MPGSMHKIQLHDGNKDPDLNAQIMAHLYSFYSIIFLIYLALCIV